MSPTKKLFDRPDRFAPVERAIGGDAEALDGVCNIRNNGRVRYLLGRHSLDLSKLELSLDGDIIHVEPQVFDVLAYLVEHRDRVVTKEELLDEVWNSRFVSESALTSRVKAARYALGDDGATQASIRTIRGRGFRFVGPVRIDDDGLEAIDTDLGDAKRTRDVLPGRRTRPLPTPAARVIGREAEIATARRMLQQSRLVTVLGPGGVGKTTLAMCVATAESEHFDDGAFWCDWSTVAQPDAAADALADALDIARQPELATRESLIAGIGERRILVVVDNCEHIIDVASTLLGEIVAACPNLSILSTSRSPLGLAGEGLVPVNPLSCVPPVAGCGANDTEMSAAASLFVDRAFAANPHQQLDGHHVTIEQLCVRLDGLPLAIELAAARLRSSTIDEVFDHLTDALDVANAPQRGRIRRHQTLRDTVDWSYRLLDHDERSVFRNLWVFSGPFTANDAIAVSSRLDTGGFSPHLLDALVDHSMIVADRNESTTRYRMLETLRAYASETLTTDERADRQVAHLEWAMHAAEAANHIITGPDEAGAVRRFDQLFANLRSAHRVAIARSDTDSALRMTAALHYYAVHRLRDEAFTWAQASIALAAGTDHALVPVALGSFAQGIANRGELNQARQLATEAIARCQPLDHRALWALRTLSNVALYEGRLDQAIKHADQEIVIAEKAGDLTHVSYATVTHVLARCYAGHVESALDLALVHTHRAQRSSNPTQLAWSSFALGEASATTDPSASLAALEAALAAAAAVDSHFVAGVALVAIASTQARVGNLDEAMSTYRRTIALWHQRGDWTHQWTTLRNLVGLVHHIGRHEQAAVLLGAVTADGRGAPAFGQGAIELDRVTESIAASIGSAAFEGLTEHGRDLSPDDAVALAIDSVTSPPPTPLESHSH